MFGEKVKKIKNSPEINIEYNINNNYSDILLNGNITDENLNPNYININNIINKNRNMDSNSKMPNNLDLNNSNLNVSESNESDLKIKEIVNTEIKFLKIQIKQLKEKIESDNNEIEQLNERNAILEMEKKI